MGKKVLFFGDFGIDDIIALLYALYCPQIDVIGIVADYGNVSKYDAIRNVKYLIEATEKNDLKVIGGAGRALTGYEPIFYPTIHGPEGLGPFQPEDNNFDNNFENFYEIINIIEKYPDLVLVNVGRLTSLATAFILFPEVMKKVSDIYVMGGAFNYPGNVTPVAEANFHGDPFAANLVFTLASSPIKIIPLNITQRAVIPPHIITMLDNEFTKKGDKVGQMIKPMYDFYYSSYKDMIPSIGGGPIHDLVVMWAVVESQEVKYKKVPVSIVTQTGLAFGQSIGDFRELTEKINSPNHYVGVDFSYWKFVNSFVHTLLTGTC
ncbi:nucleoside hydrolase [Peribacillus acanthi]|uniref:nucleoside hydrolase n=1 Tax=Peribacillus acanthi TaxID=2171554 RepID=UPI000D3E6839|nr:nucleoside hydrolase [Peribacillus acanthi]